MPIKQKTPMAEALNVIESRMERWRDVIIRRLTVAGEKAVNAARDPGAAHTYTDRTGNLRSSIGYIITEDGRTVAHSATTVYMKGNEGASGWLDYAMKLGEKFPTGFALIVVAGMKYAAYVAARGYNVLDDAETIAQQVTRGIIKD